MLRDIGAALVLAFLVFLAFTVAIQPRVIGWQCEGKALPQLAAEEDELPPCKLIEPIF